MFNKLGAAIECSSCSRSILRLMKITSGDDYVVKQAMEVLCKDCNDEIKERREKAERSLYTHIDPFDCNPNNDKDFNIIP